MTHFGRRAGGQERVEVGEALAEALPPQPLAHDVPEPRAAARRRRRHNGSLVVRGRRVRSSGRGVVTTSNASQVVIEHPPVHVLSAAGVAVPPALAAHHHQARLQQRRPPLVRLERAARGRLRREDQAEAHQVVLVGAVLAQVEERIRHGRKRWRAALMSRSLAPRAPALIYVSSHARGGRRFHFHQQAKSNWRGLCSLTGRQATRPGTLKTLRVCHQ